MPECQIVVVRHAQTAWNALGKIQGHHDEPLSDLGRESLRGLRIPRRFTEYRWLSSPLSRCVETANLLGGSSIEIEPRMKEMNWGCWEGRSLASLRQSDPGGMRRNEARGIDFRPLGGESPREVTVRLSHWLNELCAKPVDVVACCHKGVIRALLALALDWDMKHKAPVKLDWGCCHRFGLSTHGHLRLVEPNIPLEQV